MVATPALESCHGSVNSGRICGHALVRAVPIIHSDDHGHQGRALLCLVRCTGTFEWIQTPVHFLLLQGEALLGYELIERDELPRDASSSS